MLLPKKLQRLTVIGEKAAQNTFILKRFSLITVWLCNFRHKNIGAKAAHKMLMKFTT